MKTFSKFLTGAVLTASLAIGVSAFAQMPTSTTTNGWPITGQNVYPPVIGTLGAGPYTILNAVVLPPFTTNQYVPGQFSSTNASGANMNQVFIGASYWQNAGFQLISTVVTNTTVATVNGTVVATFNKTANGVHVNGSPSAPAADYTLTLTPSSVAVNQCSNYVYTVYSAVFSNYDLSGCAGLYLTSLGTTNPVSGGATNYVTLIANPKIIKSGSVPMTATQ